MPTGPRRVAYAGQGRGGPSAASRYLDKRQGKANYAVILDNLARFESKEAAPAPEPGQGAGKRFLIHEIVIRDVEAHVRVVEAGGLGKLDVVVPEVRVQNLGGADRPLTLAELSAVVVKAVLASIATRRSAIERIATPSAVRGGPAFRFRCFSVTRPFAPAHSSARGGHNGDMRLR